VNEPQYSTPRRSRFVRVDLLHAHGSPTRYLYRHRGCRCVACSAAASSDSFRYQNEHREEHRANNRKYASAHREEQGERERRYRAENPEANRAHNHARRARLRGAQGTHTAADIAAQRTRQKGSCYWCGTKVGRHYHVDHVMPVILGGSNGPENLVIACAPCNLSKHDRHPADWAGIMF